MLVAAVIQAESKFKPQAVSNQGARGLMQMMPETAQWVARNIGEEAFFEEHLNEPEISIRFGTWYLASLKQEFQGNEVLKKLLVVPLQGSWNISLSLHNQSMDPV